MIEEEKNKLVEYREAISVLSYIEDTIESLYENMIIHSMILKETYNELKLTPENIKASIIKVIYNCRKLNEIDDEDIIDNLNSEFLKANIEFGTNSPYNSKPRYPNSGILNSDADSDGIIRIYVNSRFIFIVKNLNILSTDIQFNQLIEDLYKIYTHEITHIDQFNKQEKIQPGINPDELQTSYQNLKYLASYQEIDARARELANTLLLEGKTFEDIKEMFKNYKSLLKYTEFKIYWMNFGIYNLLSKENLTQDKLKDINQRINVFKKFKRRVFDFILLDKKYVNKGHLIYTINKKS